MTVEFFASEQRLALLGVIAVAAGAAIALRLWSRGQRWTVAATAVAVLAVIVLVAERLIASIIGAAAPIEADFNEFRWVLLSPWGYPGLIAGAVVAVAVVAASWRASRRIDSPWRRAALLGLRCGAVAAALTLFLEPAIELRQVAREPNRVAVLIDRSQSMDLREEQAGPRRVERTRAFLDRSRPVFDRWQGRHEIDVFEFADTLVPSSLRSAATERPGGNATLMRQALEQVRARYDGDNLAGMVLVSDGVATGNFRDEQGATIDFLQSLDTRVHTAWAGRPGLKDVAVARVLADEFAFVRTVVRLEVVIRATGYEQRRIPVTLRSDGRDLRRKWAEIGPGDSEVRVTFELSPPRVGKYVFQIVTPVADDEAVATNNQRAVVLRVIRDKIRVLQVAGQPSWDVRALRRMLKQNPNIDLISFFILRTLDDHSGVPNTQMSLIPFPTRELFEQQLPSFDLILLQNFEFAPYGIGQYLENIRSYVEGGGGLVMLGGALSFSAGGYAGTPVAEALPVELPAGLRGPLGTLDTASFRPRLTREGVGHPVTSLRFEVADNRAAWRGLPALEGINLVAGVRPKATVLAVHPRLKTAAGKAMPVIVSGEYGDGRTLAVTTDSLWRWGFVAAAAAGDNGRHYDKLWENAIRWLIRDPELRYLHVHSDSVEYPPGAPVRLDVRVLDRDYTPLAGAQVALEVVRGADPQRTEPTLRHTLTVGDSGEGSHQLSGLEPGVYRVRATATVAERTVTATDIFLVRAASDELDQPSADESLLQAIAAATGGQYLGTAEQLPAELPLRQPQVVRVDRRTDVELWSRPALLFLAFVFLGLEWVLRQRSGYL